MKYWILVILATLTLGGCRTDAGVAKASQPETNSTAPTVQGKPASLPSDEPKEAIAEVNEDGNDPDDPNYEPRTTVGDNIYEAEQNIPVGKWGAVFAGLVLAKGADVDGMYKHGYEELEVKPDGTFVWWGWRWGTEFKKSGTWARAEINKASYLVIEDKAMLFEGEKGIKDVVFLREKRYAKFYKAADGFYYLEPYAGRVGTMFWGVRYDLERRAYYDIWDNRLGPAKR